MENTLFEAGKLLSKHLTFLVSSLILLILLVLNMDGKDVIKVPIISVDLERFDAISVVLLFNAVQVLFGTFLSILLGIAIYRRKLQ